MSLTTTTIHFFHKLNSTTTTQLNSYPNHDMTLTTTTTHNHEFNHNSTTTCHNSSNWT